MHFFVIRIKYLIFALALIGMLIFVCVTSGKPIAAFLSDGREIPIYSVERSDNKIALTFDSAWNDNDIDEIIATLKQYNCTATFFVTGKWAEDYSCSLNKLYRNGFEIGIHSYNHSDYAKMSRNEIFADIEKCDRAVMKVTGAKPNIARTPSGSYNNTAVKAVEDSGKACIQWSVDGLDYIEGTSEDDIYNRIIDKVRNGDIILLHNGTKLTSVVLPKILEYLNRNFELVNVSDLIYKSDFTIDHAGRQHMTEIY